MSRKKGIGGLRDCARAACKCWQNMRKLTRLLLVLDLEATFDAHAVQLLAMTSLGLCVCLWVHKGSGGSRSLPASLFQHMSMGQALNPPAQKNHALCSPCSHGSSWSRPYSMWVIAKRLGCPRGLAHAPGHAHFLGASTTRRTASLFSRPPTTRTSIQKLKMFSASTWLFSVRAAPCV